ncbi:ent-kaur-16-ene synthase [Pyrus ussuriensis x Pyrus communis]|uniref:Ent-kaur-16-ene synthase n=1 Tax=Pyrus ussuriensis x Pyrus communis TaxID=2448454 RepID=A0A5N5GJ03_9ROSA|nr:ent-kaur-16-ene synthase [Pyrus ussuriensis x Pyrus communis]
MVPSPNSQDPFFPECVNWLLCNQLHDGNSEGWRAFLAYISEGNAELQDWQTVMKYQRKNGSLFNSPSTTAAAFTHTKNADCLQYLRRLLDKFGNAVPTIYPLDKYARLSMVSSLESLGIDRHFRDEIRSVIDETYRLWLQGDEEIFSDAATCAMAFRLLHPLVKFSEDCFFNSYGGYLKDVSAALELFKASKIIIHPDESILEKQNYWTSHFLKEELSNMLIQPHRPNKHIALEVDHALKSPYHANLGRLSTKRAIKHYNTDGTRILKSSYSSLNIGHEDFLELAVEDYNICQSIHRKEFNHLERWVVEHRLDKLKFARQKQAYCYLSAAADLFPPELSDARMSWAKNAFLTTVVDDFFDIDGSEEELINLIQMWLDCLNSMLKEAEWSRNKSVPTMDEYMANAGTSFALGPIVLPALYFVGPKLSEEVVGNSELQYLFTLMSTCGRLLNDVQSFKTRELLRVVLLEKGSVVPRACKDLFWNLNKVMHLFYWKDDGYVGNEMMKAVNEVIGELIVLQ